MSTIGSPSPTPQPDGDVPPLVSAQWLHGRMGDPALRVYDCTVLLGLDPRGPGTVAVSGRAAYQDARIPGSGFLDLLTDLSDPDAALRFTLPGAERFASAMERAGVDDTSTVVLYDRRGNMWAARVWMMLRAFSFAGRAAVLDGGFAAWERAGYAVSGAGTDDMDTYGSDTYGQRADVRPTFAATLRPGVFTDRHEVLRGDACIVNSLSAAQHRGEPGASHYGRPGRIAGSTNVGWDRLVDPDTGCLLPVPALRDAFAVGGVDGSRRVVTYCGGGIAASLDAFALHLIGIDDVAVYDGSLMEWTADPSLPMEIG